MSNDWQKSERTPSEGHSLRRLFLTVTERNFVERLGWPDGAVMAYVSNLLTDFTFVENLHRIRDARGKGLDEVGQMLLEADCLANAGSIDREREVYRHIGDFVLFMLGVFPEYLRRIKAAGLVHHTDFLIDYVKVGKRSYHNVSAHDYGVHRDRAPLFKKLSENFELCVMGLGYVRGDLTRMQDRSIQRAVQIFQT